MPKLPGGPLPNLAGWTKRRRRVTVRNRASVDPEFVPQRLTALCRGPWMIHRFFGGVVGIAFRLSHAPTGGCVPHTHGFPPATLSDLAFRLEQVEFPWSTRDVKQFEAHRDRLLPVVDQWVSEHGHRYLEET